MYFTWEIDCIRFVQQLNHPAILFSFKIITSLGGELFFLAALPYLWIAQRKFAVRLTFALLVGALLNYCLKEIFARPRPFVLFPALQLAEADGYAFPSGHAQIAVIFWGMLAWQFRKHRFTMLAIALMALIGISRVYLGVHFPTDVLAGWIVGAIFLVVFQRLLYENIAQWIAARRLTWQLAVAFFPCVFVIWHQTELFVSLVGATVGMGVGILLMHKRNLNTRPASWRGQLGRGVLAIAGVVLLYIGLKTLAGFITVGHIPVRLIRYATLTIWISYIAPALGCYLFPPREEAI